MELVSIDLEIFEKIRLGVILNTSKKVKPMISLLSYPDSMSILEDLLFHVEFDLNNEIIKNEK